MGPKKKYTAYEPDDYDEEIRLMNVQMQEYRTNGMDYNSWDTENVTDAVNLWGRDHNPIPGHNIIFNPDRISFEDEEFWAPQRDELTKQANNRVRMAKTHFKEPDYKFQRVLGAGGSESAQYSS